MNWKVLIFAILVAFLTGFFVGRGKVRTETKVERIEGKTVREAVPVPKVHTSYIPKIYFLPTITDTIYKEGGETIVQRVDTALIIEEYIKRNIYQFTAFDNENGKLDVEQSIQYNELKEFNYTFTPIQMYTTVTQKPIFEPFVSFGYNTLQQANIGGGFFYHNIGIEYNYILSNTNGHYLGIKYKF